MDSLCYKVIIIQITTNQLPHSGPGAFRGHLEVWGPALLTRHQSSGSVPLSVAVSQSSAVVCVLRLALTDQLENNKES